MTGLHIFLPRTVKDPRKGKYFTQVCEAELCLVLWLGRIFGRQKGWTLLIINAALPMSLMAQKLLLCEKKIDIEVLYWFRKARFWMSRSFKDILTTIFHLYSHFCGPTRKKCDKSMYLNKSKGVFSIHIKQKV